MEKEEIVKILTITSIHGSKRIFLYFSKNERAFLQVFYSIFYKFLFKKNEIQIDFGTIKGH